MLDTLSSNPSCCKYIRGLNILPLYRTLRMMPLSFLISILTSINMLENTAVENVFLLKSYLSRRLRFLIIVNSK